MTIDQTITASGYRAGLLMNEAIRLLDAVGLALPAAQLASTLASLDASLASVKGLGQLPGFANQDDLRSAIA